MIAAITGGIGSGKSYVCGIMARRGIVVYDCDDAAKRLINTSTSLQTALSKTIGRDIFAGGRLDKAAISEFIVASEDNVQKVNSVVHPAVADDFMRSGCQWFESAILFESGFYRRLHIDFTVCVTAPLETRIARVMHRDVLSRGRAMEWIERQMPQDEKLKRSDYEIINDGQADVEAQLDMLFNELKNIIK